MNTQLSDSQTYTAATGALDGFLNLEPLVDSIQKVLNDYQPAAYAIAFVLLTVGTMREFLYPETRRFFEAILRAVLLVASISFATSFIDWCRSGGTSPGGVTGRGTGESWWWILLNQARAGSCDNAIGRGFAGEDQRKRFRQNWFGERRCQRSDRLRSFLRIRWISEKTWELPGVTLPGSRKTWLGKFCSRFTSYVFCSAR